MGQPILIRGQWWYEQADGSWLRWSESGQVWEAQSAPPPPPEAAEATPAVAADRPEPAPAQAPVRSEPPVQAPAPTPAPAQSPLAGPGEERRASSGVSSQSLMAGPEAARRSVSRPPADQLIVPESYVVSTQQRGGASVEPGGEGAGGEILLERVAPNVTRVVSHESGSTVITNPLQQIRAMAALKLTAPERAAAERQFQALAGCLAPEERIVGLASGTEQVTGFSGLVAVTDRQMLFIGQPGGETQLLCPLDQIELVGYEDLGGLARLSVTANGRVTSWRDVPTFRAAEIAQLVENRGAMARAVAPPVLAAPGIAGPPPMGTSISEASPEAAVPPPSSVLSAGEVSVHRSEPRPSEIVLEPSGQTDDDWRSKARSFLSDLRSDPATSAGRSPGAATRAAPRRSTSQVTQLRLTAAGAIALALISLATGFFILRVIVSGAALALGLWVYRRNRAIVRDQISEGLAIGGIIIAGISLGLALLWYF